MTFQNILARLRKAICEQTTAPEIAAQQKASLMLRKSGILERRLQTGETAPDFMISCRGSDDFPQLYDLLQQGPVILNFFRGSWCEFCLTELQAFTHLAETFQAKGATCLALSPQHPDTYPQELAHAFYPNGILVHDENNRIAKAFGLTYPVSPEYQHIFTRKGLNLAKLHCSEHWELPLAATYLIQPDHTVVFSYVETDFRKRFDPELLLEQL
jgi:peroxiredoxin